MSVKLSFNLTEEDIKSKVTECISEYKDVVNAITNVEKGNQTYENTILPLIHADNQIALVSNTLTFPQNVSTSKSIRDQACEAEKLLDAFDVEMSQNEPLYVSIREFDVMRNKEEVTDEQNRYIFRILRDFRRKGLELSKELRDVLAVKLKELSELQTNFSKNLNEVVTTHSFTIGELDGLPEDFIKGLKHNVDGTFIIGLKYPEVFPVLNLCKVETTRKTMETLMSSRCMHTNTLLLEKAVELRQDIAVLLGYATHAHYRLEDRMAKVPENVELFLDELMAKCQPGGIKDLSKMKELKKQEKLERGEEFDGKINMWDFRYYHNMMLVQEYQVDNESIKKYFPLDKVLAGMFDIYQQLLGLKFTQVEFDDRWHEEMISYEVYDSSSNNFIGRFFMDLHPRDGKYGHAAVWPLQKGVDLPDGTRQTPLAGMLCNFTKPSEGRPLLQHSEVVTLFHEFGHVMHNLCTKATICRFSATSTERDFVEAPSQMLENWCWQPKSLRLMSGHFKTGAPLPDTIIEKMLAAKNVNKGIFTLRQLFFALFDFKLHSSPAKLSPLSLWESTLSSVMGIENTPGTNGAAAFGHIMGGYDCGYYGYLYSEVFSADMFSVFKTGGILNSELGMKYRNTILAPGGTVDGLDMIVNFLERKPNQNSFLESIGLTI